jgi:hypothetical protein
VAPATEHVDAEGTELRHGLVNVGTLAGADHDLGAVLAEPLGDRETDPVSIDTNKTLNLNGTLKTSKEEP